MINLVWFMLMSIGILFACGTGKIAVVSNSIFIDAGKAIEFAIGLAGIMAFWSGILKIAEAAGITETIAGVFHPLFSKLFPRLPKNHKVLGLISMTVTANLLGLGNVATPLGLQTMAELKNLSPDQESASDATCTFMALVFGGLSLIPSSLIAIRVQAGSANPALIIGPVFIISLAGTCLGLIINYLALKFTRKISLSSLQ